MDVIFNPFAGSQRSWQRSALIAAAFEIAVVAPLAFFPFGPDSPVPFYFGLVFQFPASLLFEPLTSWAKVQGFSASAAFLFGGSIVVIAEWVAITVILRKPWSRLSPSECDV
jgi:hypothetical protein